MANPVWDYRIASPTLGENQTAADWLKEGLSAHREARAARQELAGYRAEVTALRAEVAALKEGTPSAPGEVLARLEALGAQVAELSERLRIAGDALDG